MYWEKGALGNLTPEFPLWVQMETGLAAGTSLAAMLFSKLDKPTAINKLSIVLKNSIKILNQVRKVLSLPETSVYTPICYNHSFSPPWSDRTYFVWKEKGLCSIKDLYVEGRFASFNQLREKFDLPHSHFFRYVQIRPKIQILWSPKFVILNSSLRSMCFLIFS